jgi:predicted AlkP superfamily pyrophosphatase or phosphodiesterase
MRMIRPVTWLAALALALVAGSSCGKAHYLLGPEPDGLRSEARATRLTSHIIVVSVDGLRPDAIGTFKAPTLLRLIEEGSYTLHATTITPSKTLPSHTSMLTGQPPETHGVLWNNVLTAQADVIGTPTVFGVARARGYATAAFFSKPKFRPLQQPGTLDYSQAPGGWFRHWSATRTVNDVERHLGTARPNLLFVHLAEPDKAGHRSRWMSPAYGRAVIEADAAIARLMRIADEAFGRDAYTLIVTADHGGRGYDHGSDHPEDVTIPWIAWGRGVRPGELTGEPVRTMDTASTVLWLLGLEEPTEWPATPVVDAFVGRAAREAF